MRFESQLMPHHNQREWVEPTVSPVRSVVAPEVFPMSDDAAFGGPPAPAGSVASGVEADELPVVEMVPPGESNIGQSMDVGPSRRLVLVGGNGVSQTSAITRVPR